MINSRYSDYDVIAEFYDEMVADALPARLLTIDAILDSYSRSQPKSLLDLGCGTGLILEHYASRLAVTGIDASTRLLEEARRKLPHVDLHNGDICKYSTGKTFDVVVCLYDTINHLLSIEAWEAAIENARGQTASGGLFVLDMNTTEKLRQVGTVDDSAPTLDEVYKRPLVKWLTAGYVSIDISTDKTFISRWDISYFKRASDGRFDLLKTCVTERAYPIAVVHDILNRYFSSVECFDSNLGRGDEDSGRIYFVCGTD